jgi:hypothetical protein
MPDKKIEDTQETPIVAPGVPINEVADLVAAFKETLKDVTKATEPVVAIPSMEDKAEKKRKLVETWAAAKQKANEMAAAGEAAESVEYLLATHAELSANSAVDQTTTPLFKSIRGTAKRAAKADHPEMFEKYAKEIEALVSVRPAEEQIDSDVWDSMINQVRATHIDEIVNSQVESAIQKRIDEHPEFTTVVASGGGSRKQVAPKGLTEDQMYIADGLGLSYEKYTEQAAKYNAAKIGANTVMLVSPDNPKPGQF